MTKTTKTKSTKKKKLSIKNSKILHNTMVTLGALKEVSNIHELPINEIQVHLLDEDGEGIILCLEYDEFTGELNKTFTDTDEFYNKDEEIEVELNAPHYYGENNELDDVVALDPCISPENRTQRTLKTKLEEVISEEYEDALSDIFADEKLPPLLN